MKTTVDVKAKYGACVAPNAEENSTLGAAKALKDLLSPIVSIVNTWAGNTTNAKQFDLAQMTLDGVPDSTVLSLNLEWGNQLHNVGVTVNELRLMPANGLSALGEITGISTDSILANYVRAKHPEILDGMTAAASAVVKTEDSAS